jgi:hypothetical protein
LREEIVSKVESLYGTTPAEIVQSGLENVDEMEAIVTAVLWKDGTVTAGWSNIDVGNLARLILVLDERQRRTTIPNTD